MSKITELATALGQAIKADPVMKKMDEMNEKYNADKSLCALVDEYNAISQTLTELYTSENRDEAAIKSVEERMTELYNEITENPLMIEYQEAQNAVNELMNEVNGEITYQITGERPCNSDCSHCGHHCH